MKKGPCTYSVLVKIGRHTQCYRGEHGTLYNVAKHNPARMILRVCTQLSSVNANRVEDLRGCMLTMPTGHDRSTLALMVFFESITYRLQLI